MHDSPSSPPIDSVCVVFVLSEAPGGGLPNGRTWLSLTNITTRLDETLRTARFSHAQFCLILTGEQIPGRTVRMGGSSDTNCGTASELSSAVSRVWDRGDEYDMSGAITSQLSNGSTCAGRSGHVTVVVALAPIAVYHSQSGLLKALLSNSASMIVFGDLDTDSATADEWVLAIDGDGLGYEAVPGEGDFRTVTDAESIPEGSLSYYQTVAFKSGGAMMDANWLGDEEYQPSLNAIFLHLSTDIARRLRKSSCSVCQCHGDHAHCTSPLRVIKESACNQTLV